MAAIFQLAGYYLDSFKVDPYEKACTRQLRKWGVSSTKEQPKYPVLETALLSGITKSGIKTNLYHPNLKGNASCSQVPLCKVKSNANEFLDDEMLDIGRNSEGEIFLNRNH